jgi:phospholipid-binding lipoprotein MlaA
MRGNAASSGTSSAAALAVVALLALGGCAEPPKEPEALAAYNEANDPLEPTNRAILSANLAVDDAVVKPAAKAYRAVPEFLRKGLHNMIVTVRSPALFANEVMQGDISAAADVFARMLTNLTLGIGGFFDVATQAKVPNHDTDFGVTLAKWGVGEGPYLMLPLFGPSNPRDTVGLVVDMFMDPIGYFTTFGIDAGRFVFEGIDKREPNIEPLEEIQRTSVDFYATLRSLYRQRRDDEIRTGTPQSIPAPAISFDDGLDTGSHPAPAATSQLPAVEGQAAASKGQASTQP